MKLLPVLILALLLNSGTTEAKAPATSRQLAAESAVVTNHKAKINNQKISYRATAGTQPVWNDDEQVIASLFYTYYQRTDVKDTASRPLLISFNGGPGSASVWMHVAYTGPRILNIDDEGYPVQPYGVQDNPFSVLDVADIVFVNPVNTGFSRIITPDGQEKMSKKEQQKQFSRGQCRRQVPGGVDQHLCQS